MYRRQITTKILHIKISRNLSVHDLNLTIVLKMGKGHRENET